MKSIQLRLAILLAILIASCSKPSADLNPIDDPVSVKATDVDLATLDKDVVEHYKDIAVLAEWYADHPTLLKSELNRNTTGTYTDSTYNDFVAELAEIQLTDENGKSITFFDLDEEARHAFLKDYVKLESKFLDDKFKLVNNEAVDDNIESMNAAFNRIVKTAPFSDTFDFDAEAKKITSSHPYEDLNADIEQAAGDSEVPTNLESQPESTDQSFLKFLADTGILNFALVTYNPLNHKNSPQEFVDKMRNHLERGRVLVSMPGGYNTSAPLVFDNKGYDVGHVAIISKNASDVPSKIDADFKLTIGTNSKDNMHEEKIGPSWTENHSVSYLMQPVRISYEYTPKKVGFVSIPYWSRQARDVTNNDTYQKIAGTLGRPYCKSYQMMTAKWAAPERFICSSSAWWAIKEAHGFGIGHLLKPTIFPAGVYESENMRVVAQTF